MYAYRDRCAGCHSYGGPYSQDGLAPEWLDPGADWDAVLASMYNAIGRGYLDEVDPASSLGDLPVTVSRARASAAAAR